MIGMFKNLLRHRELIWTLAKNDFRSRYLGSVLGIAWAFVLPFVNLAIIWFAFEHGFRATPTNGVPFILWLVTGMFPWSFFTEAVQSTSQSILDKAFLVKKVVFHVELLPLIKVIAALVPFVFLSALMLGLFLLYGFSPDLYWFQLGYNFACLIALVLSLSWGLSSVVIFYRDLTQFVSISLQVAFWLTPIFWSPDMLRGPWRLVTLLNPVAYVVGGFRDSLIGKRWFWETPAQTLYFWSVVAVLSAVGAVVFRRLRPHFADVL